MPTVIRECVQCGHSRYTDRPDCPLCGSLGFIIRDGEA